MTRSVHWGGIPPDEDHRALMSCSHPRCNVTHKDEPLVVCAFGGKMMVFCQRHLEALRRQHWQGTP